MMWPMWNLPLAYGKAVVTNNWRAAGIGRLCFGEGRMGAKARNSRSHGFRLSLRPIASSSIAVCVNDCTTTWRS